MGGLTQLLLAACLVCLLLQPCLCRPSKWKKAMERKELRRLLDLLKIERQNEEKKEERRNYGAKTVARKRTYEGEFILPDDFYWGGEEYLIYEDDGLGHGYDVIDGTFDLDSIETALFASFEVMINGEIVKPYIDYYSMHVQNAQNKDHHKSYRQKRSPSRRHLYINRRNFDNSPKWENGIIPYEIDTNTVDTAERQEKIRKGVKEMNDLTCLKIEPAASVQNPPHNSILRFTDDNDGCWSYVGRVHSPKQELGLGDGCYDKSTVLHEIMHAIGMQHEQQRTDRDKYMTMLWQNIAGGQENNNMKLEQTNDKNSFDLESVLMYGIYSSSTNEEKTMDLKDKRLEFLPESAKGLTFYDVKDITVDYNCTMSCTGSSPSCTNTGFLGWNCKCVCPPGLKGTVCENVDSDSGCGGVINLASGQSQTIQSTNYPNNHPVDQVCVWLIKGPTNSKIKLDIQDLKLKYNSENERCYHWLEYRYNLIAQTGPKRCGTVSGETVETADTEINGRHNYMLLRFDSRFSKDVAADKGFKVKVEAVGGDTTPPSNCNPNPCQNNGVCSTTSNGYTCQCASGFTGTNCQTAVANPCDSNPCKNGGVCSNSGGSFSCQCSGGWTGTTCEDSSSSCSFEPSSSCFLKNNYTPKQATSSTTPPTAVSGSHYVQPTIQEQYITLEIDPAKVTLTNGNQYCFEFSYFIEGSDAEIGVYAESDTYFETPLKRWTGATNWKTTDYGFTASNDKPMLDILVTSGAVAVDDVTLKDGSCTSGQPCDSSPCKNSGTCTNTGSSYSCQCTSGWSGPTCEVQVQPCDSSPCKNGATCTNSGTSYTCQCTTGWSGPTCEVRPCDSSPCKNGATCTNSGNSYTCACTSGWTGSTCEVQVQPCDSSPCKNGASCTNSGSTYSCTCASGWSGPTCDVQVQPCDSSPCKNGATCTNSGSTFSCTCNSGWSGPTCEVTASSSTCTFEPSSSCFLTNDYTPVQATSQTTPTSAQSGSYFVQPAAGEGEFLTLMIDQNSAGLTIGQTYCLGFAYTISGSDVEIGIYDESDTSFANPRKTLSNPTSWTTDSYTFTASSNDNPVIDVYYIGSGTAAIDDVTLTSGQC